MKVLLTIVLTISFIGSFAQASLSEGCTHWVTESGVSCTLPDASSGRVWKRNCDNSPHQCRNPKVPKNRKPCPSEVLCMGKRVNPNFLGDECSAWIHRRSTSCINGEDSWYRVCTINYIETTTCSNSNPNN